MQRQNRLTICECGAKLKKYKNPVIINSGFAFRSRQCSKCGRIVFTAQPPEVITGIEQVANAEK